MSAATSTLLDAAISGPSAAERERDRLAEDNANLRTVMVAAAEEIQAHWAAHCDADGYGPANLMRRLECGIPSQYGYTAGAFGAMHSILTALCDRAELHMPWKTVAPEDVEIYRRACEALGREPKC